MERRVSEEISTAASRGCWTICIFCCRADYPLYLGAERLLGCRQSVEKECMIHLTLNSQVSVQQLEALPLHQKSKKAPRTFLEKALLEQLYSSRSRFRPILITNLFFFVNFFPTINQLQLASHLRWLGIRTTGRHLLTSSKPKDKPKTNNTGR